MHYNEFDITGKKAVAGKSEPVFTDELKDKAVLLKPGAAATLQLQVSQKRSGDTDWTDYGGPAVNVNLWVEVPVAVARMRTNTTAYAAGDPVSTVSGMNVREAG